MPASKFYKRGAYRFAVRYLLIIDFSARFQLPAQHGTFGRDILSVYPNNFIDETGLHNARKYDVYSDRVCGIVMAGRVCLSV